MSFAANSSIRKPRRKKTHHPRSRLNKRAYLFESLEERLNLSLMFPEVEPNNDTPLPGTFANDLTAAQKVIHPGLTTGVVDSLTMTTAINDDADYYTFTATVAGAINVAAINRGGDPQADAGADNLDVRVFRVNPADVDDTIGLANTLPVGQTYTGAFSATADEKFYVRVSGDAGDDDANYDLRIWNTEASDSGGGNNNSINNAEDLGGVDTAAGAMTSGTITQPDRDFYEFTAGADGKVSVRITMPEGTGFPFGPTGNEPTNLGVRVRDAGGRIIATSNGTAGNVDIASFDATSSQVYYAEVYSGSFGQVNRYDLDISLVDAAQGRITGYVFRDDNQDTLRDSNESILPGFDVSLDVNGDGGATTDLMATTNAQGFYEFANVPFGMHRVYITPQPGFHTVYPTASENFAYLITVGADNLNMDHIDFATVEADFGDAPDSYLTLLASDGPRHTLGTLRLGSEIDAESDGFDSSADGDDTTPVGGLDDEDGVSFTSPIIQGTDATVDVVASGAGTLNAWVDFDGSGSFDGTERIFADRAVVAGTNSLTFAVPDSVAAGTSYARFRLSSVSGLKPLGSAPDGEVEDSQVTLLQNTISIGNRSLAEGNNGTTNFSFTVTLDAASNRDISLSYSTQDDSATEPSDYAKVTIGSLTFLSAASETTKNIVIQVVGDLTPEPDETFFVNLSGVTGPAVLGTAQGTGTILNDDSGLSITADTSADQAEGDSGNKSFTFTVTRLGDTSGTATVDYAVTFSGLADAADFTAPTTGMVSFGVGDSSMPITVLVKGDTVVEPDETFTVTLSNPSVGAAIAVGSALGTIRNDDVEFNILVMDADKSEGNGGTATPTPFTFEVTRTAINSASSVDYVVAGSGTAPEADAADFVGGFPSGTVNFAANETTQTVTINVVGDTLAEANDQFTVTLLNPSVGTIVTGTANGTIRNDDSVNLVVVAVDANKPEGTGSPTAFQFTVNRSGGVGAVSADYSVVPGSGANPANAADFSGAAPSGMLTWADGDVTSRPITVLISGDSDVELDETFEVMLSNPSGATISGPATGTIINDDADLDIAATDANKAEGDVGNTSFTFTITRSGDVSGSVDVDYAVTGSGGDPANTADFGGTFPSGTANFAANDMTVLVTILVTGDMAGEPDEGFTVTLSNVQNGNAEIGSMGADDGTIVNDDLIPVISIASASPLAEGNGGAMTTFTFQVSRTGDTSATASVAYTVSGGVTNPADGNDFVGGTLPTGNVNFGIGESMVDLDILVNGDGSIEADEQFVVTLSNPSAGASLGTATASSTINNDDSVDIFGTKTDALSAPIAGVTFELFRDDAAPFGVFNPASPFAPSQTGVDSLVQTVVTGADGHYNFGAALANGTYYIREVPSAGWYQTSPNGVVTVVYSGTTVNVDTDSAATPTGPFVNARCSDNRFETSAILGQMITATRAGILTIEVLGDVGVSFNVTSTTAVQGLSVNLVKVTGISFASRSSGTNRARVDLVLTASDVGKMFSIANVLNATNPTLLVANSVFVDTARNLIIQGTNCADSIFVRDDPAAGGSNSDAKSIFVGSYAGSMADFNNGTNLVSKFNGVKYNAAIINASYNDPIIAGIQIFGGNGNDIIRVGAEIIQDSSLDGGSGDDVIRAGGGRATIFGRAGSDFIVGGRENDVLYGDEGNDYIHGRAGGDRIFGGDGNDLLSGGEGDDPLIRGQNGDDILSGGTGRDRLIGDGGTDTGYREVTGTGASVDLFVSIDNPPGPIDVPTAPSGSLLGDLAEDELLALINRFWADGNAGDGPDTLDEIIAQLLP
ncbi:MAG: GEVED domain-containing protein [Planctomycetota bacterium]|nr:GEVED domain-containing protein [Planctomycetota bacterium]